MMTDHDDPVPASFKNGFIDGLNELLDIDDIIILSKDVRDYGGRKRINITNSDGLVKDDAVVVLRKSDYDDIMKERFTIASALPLIGP